MSSKQTKKETGVPVATVKELAKETFKKPITLVQEPCILADGSTLKPLQVKNSSDVLRTSLLMLFKHISDIHVTVVEVISEKFGIPIEDIHKAITEDPRWEEMFVHPLITDLTATIEENKLPAVPPSKTETKTAKKPIVIDDEEELIF